MVDLFKQFDGGDSDLPSFVDFLERIEELLDTGDYDWARETLEGIYKTVEDSERVTPGQITAVDNIENRGG